MGKVDTTALLASANPAGRDDGPRVRIGGCRVEADLDRIVMPDREVAIEPKAMAVLMYLAHRPGQVISTGELIEAVWQGRPMGDNPVYRCIAQLRRAFGDDHRAPSYIATVPTKGYRLIAPVEPLDPATPPVRSDEAPVPYGQVATNASPAREHGIGLRLAVLLALLLLLLLLVALVLLLGSAARRRARTPHPRSLPCSGGRPLATTRLGRNSGENPRPCVGGVNTLSVDRLGVQPLKRSPLSTVHARACRSRIRAGAQCAHGQLLPATDAGTLEDVVQMGFHRGGADPQVAADFLVAQSLLHPAHDLVLALGELIHGRRGQHRRGQPLPHAGEGLGHQFARDPRFARVHARIARHHVAGVASSPAMPTLIQVLTTPGGNAFGSAAPPYGLNAYRATAAYLTSRIPLFKFDPALVGNECACPIDNHGNYKIPIN